jgi:hypothetical protein
MNAWVRTLGFTARHDIAASSLKANLGRTFEPIPINMRGQDTPIPPRHGTKERFVF